MEENTKYKDGVNRNARIIVRNISYKATEEELKKHFDQYGDVEEVKLLKRPDGKLVGCGFVHFTHVPMANAAIKGAHKKPFLGRKVNVTWAVDKDKYAEKLNAKKKNSSGIIKIEDNEEAEEKKEDQKKEQRINRNARLCVRNISFKAKEESLKEHFEPYGEILEVKILKKPDGKMVGCAFVHFKNVPMAKNAIVNTNMKPFLGRPISVDWAVAKNQYMRYVVEKQLELSEQVKKEDSDCDDDDETPMNISTDDLKEEVKSESGSSDNDESDSDNSDESDDSGDESDDESEDVDGDDDKGDIKTEFDDDNDSMAPERKRIQLNDAEDGCTIFITNIPFSVDDEKLKTFAEKTGQCKYALICVDKLTEHSKGTGFVKFVNKEDADTFLSLPSDQLKIDGQILNVKPALKRDNLPKGDKKQPKDNRNLYLVKEGVIVAGTKAAVGVSSSDMAKRLALERSKTQMLKNLNRFVSRYRIVVSNLPEHYDDTKLRKLCMSNSNSKVNITECRVMRDLRAALQKDGKHPSKGYGFVMFMRHEDALACLRKLNNNPDVFDKNNRPIVSFSIEDRTALNARKKRLEKSIANNPINKNNKNEQEKPNRKRKHEKPDESKIKRGKFEKWTKNQNGGPQNKYNKQKQIERIQNKDNNTDEYTGLTAKEGTAQHKRSNYKLKIQADVHKQQTKMEKKKSKMAIKRKMAAKERVKQPQQKVNKKTKLDNTEKKVQAALKEARNFTSLVSKYKSKLSGNSLEKVKSKWYES